MIPWLHRPCCPLPSMGLTKQHQAFPVQSPSGILPSPSSWGMDAALMVWPSCQLQRASSWTAGPWLLHKDGDLHHGPPYPDGATLCAGLLSCYFRTFDHEALRNDHLQASQGLTDTANSSLHGFASKRLLLFNKFVLPSKAQDSSAELVCSDFFVLLLPPNTTLAAPTVCWLLANM